MSLPDLAFPPQFNTENSAISPKILQRRFSKSRNFILRAIGGRSSEESKHIRRIDSVASKNTLIRRLSRGGNRGSDSSADSIASTSTAYFVEHDSQDITDISINSRISYGESPIRRGPSISSSGTDSTSAVSPPEAFVLCPQIIVTPELASVDGGSCNLWLAIEVTGILRRADGHGKHNEVQTYPSQSMNPQLSGEFQITH